MLLLDEPFASVDSTLRRQLRRTTREALKTAGTTAIVVTHDPDEAMELADSIAIMAAGRIAQHASPAEIWRKPATLAVALLFGDAVELAAHVHDGVAQSAFGQLSTPQFTDVANGQALLAVRPEGIQLTAVDSNHPASAVITDLRLLGHRWQVGLEALDQAMQGQSTARPARISATVQSPQGLAIGAKVHTSLDPENCFCF